MSRFLVPALVLVGCGSPSYCEKSAEWFACGEETTVSDEDLAACEEALAPCSAADQRNLIDATECLLDLGVFGFCDTTPTSVPTSTEDLTALAEAMVECQSYADAVSDACAEAAGFSTPTDFSSTPSSTSL